PRADLYSLGGTLFWCLTGRRPFPPQNNFAQDLLARLRQAPPSVREVRPEVPAELDAVVSRLMAVTPDDRYPSAQAVMRALLPFAGVDDYLTKPLSRVQLSGRIRAALRLKDAQDRALALNRQLLAMNQELERNLHARSSDLSHTRGALVLALAKVVECRDGET